MSKRLKNILIILIITIIILTSFHSYAIDYDKNSFYVTDYANVLTEDTKAHIRDVNESLKPIGSQIAVVTVKSLEGEDIRLAITELFEKMQLGSREEDNGLLILFSLEDRQIQVETGYGLEGALPDSLVVRLIDEAFIPYARNNDFDTGIRKLFDSYTYKIAEEYNLEDIENIEPVETTQGISIMRIILLFILIYIIFNSRGGPRNRYRRRPTVFIPGGFGNSGGFGNTGGFGGGFSPPSGGGGRSGGGGGGRSF